MGSIKESVVGVETQGIGGSPESRSTTIIISEHHIIAGTVRLQGPEAQV